MLQNVVAETSIAFRPIGIDDFTSLHPFSPDAANMPIAVYVRSGVEAVFPVPRTSWKRAQARSRIAKHGSWAAVSKGLASVEDAVAPVDPDDQTSPWGAVAGPGAL